MTATQKHVGVVVQTHWDREWYFTREQFLARLLRVMDLVAAQLEDGRLEQFLFDGQVAALEDLLAHAEPELAERVLALVRAGRIALGPWYVMADEFLCSGESLWRNLEIGMRDARAHGNCQTVGYLPDSFGHIAQMPQILRHHGIASAVLWRGVDATHSEFDWEAPDGTRIGTLFLTQGYYQHPFNVSHWREALTGYLAQITPRALSPNLLLTQGGDHLMPHASLAARIAEFNAEQSEFTLVQESLQAHAERVLAATEGRRPLIQGELRANAQAFVLPDVLSTRRYVKLAHQTIEDRLLYEIEPLYARLAIPLPARALDQTWRTLLQQQAHDSICGCSADAVHREMASRFEQLAQRLDTLRDAALVAAGLGGDRMSEGKSPFVDDARVTLFNPLPQARDEWQTVELFLAGDAAESVRLLDAEGQVVPSTVLSVRPHSQLHSPLDDFPDPLKGHRYEVALRCPLDGLQARELRVEKMAGPSAEAVSAIANGLLRLELDDDGQLRIHSKGSTRTLWIESELDAGDSYNFSPPADPARRRHSRFAFISASKHGAVQELTLSLDAKLPASLNAERSGPSAEDVTCRGTLRLRLIDGSPFLQARLDWDNRAQDQRTRLVIPLESPVSETWADGGFAWLRRPVVLADYPAAPSRREMPVAVNPSHSAVAAGGVHLAHRAMPEFEILALEGGAQALALTLVRSVGWLSRRDLRTRGVGAGPDVFTPEAQCIGPQVFDFRLGFFATPDHAALLREAAALRQPALALRGHGGAWRAGVELASPELQVSACRRVGERLEVRVWNPTERALPLDDAATLVPPHGIHTLSLDL